MDQTTLDKALFMGGRSGYAVGLAGLGIEQFVYPDFPPQFMPESWPGWAHHQHVWLYLNGGALVVAGILFALRKFPKWTGLITGCFFLALIVAFHIPYQAFLSPYSYHLGLYGDALEDLSLAGAAFMLTGSPRLFALGRTFFCINMTCFGLCHFLYTPFISPMVPDWLPWHVFWTYFGGVALMGSGVAIALNIRRRTVALLQALMIFLWLIFLHIPCAIGQPRMGNGILVTSSLMALIFTGIACMIAGRSRVPR